MMFDHGLFTVGVINQQTYLKVCMFKQNIAHYPANLNINTLIIFYEVI